MKRLLPVFVALALLLSACAGEPPVVAASVEEELYPVVEPLPTPPEIAPEPELEPEPEPEEPDEPEPPPAPEAPPLRFPFVVPVVEHRYAQEMMRLQAEFTFPLFESLDDMDMEQVGVTLYLRAARPNEELLAEGRGAAGFPDDRWVARWDDMTAIGQRFFGQEFEFPRGLYTDMIEPVGPDSEFYTATGWGLGPGETGHLLTNVREDGRYIVATFLTHFIWVAPLLPHVDEQPPDRVTFYTDNLRQAGLFDGFVDFSFGEPSPLRNGQSPVEYLSAVDYLPVRQADLDTRTITFRREEATGNLIAVSHRFNQLDESALPFYTYLQVLRGEAELFEHTNSLNGWQRDDVHPRDQGRYQLLSKSPHMHDGYPLNIESFALIYIEGSEVPAVVLYLSEAGGDRWLLHYDSGRVGGYLFFFRGLNFLNRDGSARWSGGATFNGTKQLRFYSGLVETAVVSEQDSFFEDSVSDRVRVYRVYGEDATEEAFRAVWDGHDDKEEAVWIPFDPQSIAEDFAAAWEAHFEWLAAE